MISKILTAPFLRIQVLCSLMLCPLMYGSLCSEGS